MKRKPTAPPPTRRPRATADGIPVWCAFDKLVDPATLRGDPENYNAHPPEQLRMIAASVKSQGWQKPIVVDIRTGLTVTGHGETAAAIAAGLKLVPVDFRWYATDADRQQWLIADNRFASLAEVQAGALKDLLQKLDTGDRDMEATGYTNAAIEDLMTQVHQNLAELLAKEPVYTATDTKADTRAAKMAERLQKLAKNHRDKLEKAEAIVLSADCPDFICIDDPALTDFLAELKRYAEQGESSPLAAILGKVHRL